MTKEAVMEKIGESVPGLIDALKSWGPGVVFGLIILGVASYDRLALEPARLKAIQEGYEKIQTQMQTSLDKTVDRMIENDDRWREAMLSLKGSSSLKVPTFNSVREAIAKDN